MTVLRGARRKIGTHLLLLADPVDRPELSRNVVRLPLFAADPVDRLLASRNVV